MSDKSSKPPFGMSPIEPVFNRATRVAKTLFGALDASIVLVDGDLIWRSRDHGDLSGGARFARQIMASGELLWIEDTHLDPEMARSVAVTGSLKLRFYAGAPVRLTDGSVPGVLCVIDREPRPFDATLAKRLQDLADLVADECDRARIAAEAEHNAQELDSARRLLADFVEAIPVTVVMTDRRLGILKVSPRTLRGMGLSEAEVLGRDLLDMAPAYKPIEDVLYRALSGETVKSERYRMPRAGGGWTWVQLEVTPWREADGAVGGLILASHDVTELVVAMKRLQRSDQRLNLVLEMSQMHVYDVDYTTGAIETAGAPNNLYGPGMSFQEIAGSGLEFVDPRDRAMVGEVYRRHIEEGAPCAYEFRVNRPDQEVWVSVNAQLSLGPDGQMRRALGAMQDITERKQTEQALVRAKEEAEAASRAKSTFLATMSHEIRTPLNGVLGMAQAMAADPLDEVQRQRLNVVRQSGETLLAILNDVLDLSKIEAGKLELEETEFNLGELAKGAHAAFTAQAEEKGLAFELEVAPEALGVYVGDSTRVRQIIYNLVSNAVKFTERGKVQVQVSRPDEALVVRVRDSGIGIPDDRLTSLFQKFEQADASTTRRFGGTGLGLSICRELAALMGGTVAAESRHGEGSTFTATLPLRRMRDAAEASAAEELRHPEEMTDGAALRVLAAEDNQVNQLVLATLLGQIGVAPVIVANGREAVEQWECGDWDMILMDVQMPVLDGPSAARMIREREAALGRPRTPIIALTANAMSHQVAEYLAAGMDAFVPKPVEVGRLFAAMELVMAASSETEAA